MAHVWQNVAPARLTDILRYIILQEDRPENLETLADYFIPEFVVGQRVRWNESLDQPFTASVPFRSFSTPVPLGSRPGRSRKEAGMLPLGIAFEWTEYDMLQLEAEQAGVDPNTFFEPEIFADVDAGGRGALNRMEILMGRLLADAGFSVNENGVNQQGILAGRAAANTAPASIAWSNVGTAVPHVDEQAALTVLRTTQGITFRDVEILTNRATYEHYKTITSVREALNSVRVLSIVGDDETNALRARQDLPPIRVFERIVQDPNGNNVDVIQNNEWLIVPRRGTSPVGKVSWGTPQSASIQGVNLQGTNRAGPVAYVLEGNDPPSRKTVIDAIGAPVLQTPNWTFSITTNAGL